MNRNLVKENIIEVDVSKVNGFLEVLKKRVEEVSWWLLKGATEKH